MADPYNIRLKQFNGGPARIELLARHRIFLMKFLMKILDDQDYPEDVHREARACLNILTEEKR